MITRTTIEAPGMKTISWVGDKVIDWANGGKSYTLDGRNEELGAYYFAYSFDTAITSSCGTYALMYKRLGTKALLLKHGEELREINRPYYHAEVYEYPAAFITLPNGRVLLAHCPKEYCRIDFEDVETGELLTDVPGRKPSDCFHSRLEVSPGNKALLSKGWYWHPWLQIEWFDMEACLANPLLLDKGRIVPDSKYEINTAGFIDDQQVLIGSSDGEVFDDDGPDALPPNHLAVWNTVTNEVSPAVRVQGEFGNIYPINAKYCWDVYKYLKVIDLQTGSIAATIEEIATGDQQSSIIGHLVDKLSLVAFNTQSRRLAIHQQDRIEILAWNP